MAGPGIGGPFLQGFDIRAPFWAGGALGAVCFVICLLIPSPGSGAVPESAGAHNLSRPSRLRQIIKSASGPHSLSLSAIHFLTMMTIAILLTSAPIMTADLLGWSPSEIATAFAAGGFAAALTSPYLGRLSDRFGRVRMIVLGLAFICLQVFVTYLSPGTALVMLAFTIGGAGTPAYFNSFYSLIGDVTTVSERGGVTGFVGSFGEWGSIVGSSLVVPIAWSAISVRAPMGINTLFLLLTIVVTLATAPVLRQHVKNGPAVH
jgi:MFS family permease